MAPAFTAAPPESVPGKGLIPVMIVGCDLIYLLLILELYCTVLYVRTGLEG